MPIAHMNPQTQAFHYPHVRYPLPPTSMVPPPQPHLPLSVRTSPQPQHLHQQAATPDSIGGVGSLMWVSPQIAVIQSPNIGFVSFEIKDFCDRHVRDLTSVLRTGFAMKYQAVSPLAARAGSGSSGGSGASSPSSHAADIPQHLSSACHFRATFVSPLLSSDLATSVGGSLSPTNSLKMIQERLSKELDVKESHDEMFKNDPTRRSEGYNVEMETRALTLILNIFRHESSGHISLDCVHTNISNCGDSELYHYIGKNSIRRRNFLDRRTHMFHIPCSQTGVNDTIYLVPTQIHDTILTLAAHLLNRGGAMSLQELFDFYLSCAEIPIEARDVIGEGKGAFSAFLGDHSWIFTVFPSAVFVSVRHRLIDTQYASMCQANDGIDADLQSMRYSDLIGAMRAVRQKEAEAAAQAEKSPSPSPMDRAQTEQGVWAGTNGHYGDANQYVSPVERLQKEAPFSIGTFNAYQPHTTSAPVPPPPHLPPVSTAHMMPPPMPPRLPHMMMPPNMLTHQQRAAMAALAAFGLPPPLGPGGLPGVPPMPNMPLRPPVPPSASSGDSSSSETTTTAAGAQTEPSRVEDWPRPQPIMMTVATQTVQSEGPCVCECHCGLRESIREQDLLVQQVGKFCLDE